MSDVERRIAERLKRCIPGLVHSPDIVDCAPEVRRLIEAAYQQGAQNFAPVPWDALLGSVREEGKPPKEGT